MKGRSPAAKPGRADFPVVGMGASAGGLEAFHAFFEAMPPDSGMAFVLVQHLDPTQESHAAELLTRHTKMKVAQVEDGMRVEPDHVYIILPNRTLTLEKGVLRLRKPDERRGRRLPVDAFFNSLAQEKREKAICIILSGTGSDGTAGAKVLKAEGGLVIAQQPETAKYDGMPRSAIDSDAVDYVLPIKKMPEALLKYVGHSCVKHGGDAEAHRTINDQTLNHILVLLRSGSGRDFGDYKKSTLVRRIHRRMGLNQIKELADYLKFLREHPEEVQLLSKELVIPVTSCFRDAQAWQALEEKVIATLLKNRPGGSPIRVWVAGCSTGEEAYSLAILLAEQAEAVEKEFEIKIFATDIDEDALSRAREGFFPMTVVGDISPERLQHFFNKKEGRDGYRIQGRIRDLIAFAPQDLLRDPPFSRLDLISCRNLLIYLEAEAQNRVISLLHFALREEGYLFLGQAESIGRQEQLFEPVSKKWKIYRRIGPTRHDIVDFPLRGEVETHRYEDVLQAGQARKPKFSELARQALAARYAPASVLIDRKYQILYFHGPTDHYLAHPAGEPTRDLRALARQGLSAKLRIAMRDALRENRSVTVRGARMKRRDELQHVAVTVTPLEAEPDTEGLLLVSFEEDKPVNPAPDAQQESLYAESIVATIREPLLVLDGDLCVQSANEAFYSRFEVSPQDTKGRLVYELGNHQWDIPGLRSLLEDIVSKNNSFSDFEVEHEFESIGCRHMLLNARRLENGQPGRQPMILLAIEDVTERRQTAKELITMNKELQERRAEAEQRSAQLQAFAAELTTLEQRERRRLARVLHDSLQQFLVAAISRLSVVKKAKEKDLEPSLQALSKLLDQALDASRSLTAELSPPILEEGGLSAALNWLARWNKENHGLVVELDIDPNAESLSEDLRILIFQMVRELLFNVVKHAGVDHASVEVTREEEDQLRVTVMDSGKGFDPDDLKIDEEPTKHFGLFSLRERVNLMGGRLEIESIPGQGARVVIFVPTGPSEERAKSLSDLVDHAPNRRAVKAEAWTKREARPSGDSRIRLLLVDDHKVVREGIAALLKAFPDIELVGEAEDGQESLEMARELKPDVVLMDVSMPRLNGIEATRVISAELPETRVIGLSMHEQADMASAMLEAGAAAYLSKGGPSEDLIAAIRG